MEVSKFILWCYLVKWPALVCLVSRYDTLAQTEKMKTLDWIEVSCGFVPLRSRDFFVNCNISGTFTKTEQKHFIMNNWWEKSESRGKSHTTETVHMQSKQVQTSALNSFRANSSSSCTLGWSFYICTHTLNYFKWRVIIETKLETVKKELRLRKKCKTN